MEQRPADKPMICERCDKEFTSKARKHKGKWRFYAVCRECINARDRELRAKRKHGDGRKKRIEPPTEYMIQKASPRTPCVGCDHLEYCQEQIRQKKTIACEPSSPIRIEMPRSWYHWKIPEIPMPLLEYE